MRFPPVSALVLSGLLASAAFGLAALGGAARPLVRPALEANLHIVEMAMPAEAAFDRTSLADVLLTQILARAESDVALRMSLDENASRQLKDLIIPRLVNPNMTARMIEGSSALTTVMELAEYHGMVTATVTNHGDKMLEDVALTLPGLLRAERRDGGKLVVVPGDGLGGVRLGVLRPGEEIGFVGWLGLPPGEVIDLAPRIRVGAGAGVDGRVFLFGREEWYGRDLEVLPWARWLIGMVLAGTVLASAFGLVVMTAIGVRAAGVRARASASAADG